MIRRANQAAAVHFKVPLPLISGQPLLVFIAKEHRRALLSMMGRLEGTQGFHTGGCLVRCRPLFDPPFVAFLTGERVENSDQNFVSIVWWFSTEAK
jgi:hypothetical protein